MTKLTQAILKPIPKPATKTISLRLPQHWLDAIKSAANSRDVPYQSRIKVWLQEKVHNHGGRQDYWSKEALSQ